MEKPEKCIIIYEGGYEQLLTDIVEVGTLIDPDTGDDLAVIGFRVLP
jgi:hypothetical protein